MALGQTQVVKPRPRRPRLSYVLHATRLGAFRLKTDQTTRQYTSEVNEPEQGGPTPGCRNDNQALHVMSSAVSGRRWLRFPRLLLTGRGDGYLLVQSWNDRPSVFLSLADAVSLRRTCVTQCRAH
jgi:hypothetical protein